MPVFDEYNEIVGPCEENNENSQENDENRRHCFYFLHKDAIANMAAMTIMDDQGVSMTGCIDRAALIISEIAKRAGSDVYLVLGDPEFNGATDIDEL